MISESKKAIVRFIGLHPAQIKDMLADRVARLGNTCHDATGKFCGEGGSEGDANPPVDSRAKRLNPSQKKIFDATTSPANQKAYLDHLEKGGKLDAAPAKAPAPAKAAKASTAKSNVPVGPSGKPLISTSGREVAPQTGNPNPDSAELTAVKKNITAQRGKNQPGYKFVDVSPLGSSAPRVDDHKAYVKSVSDLTDAQLVGSAKGNIIQKADGSIVAPRPASSHLREKLETFGIADEMLNKGADGHSKLENMLRDDKPVHEEIRSDATGGSGTSLIYYRPEHPGYVYNVTIKKGAKPGEVHIVTVHVEKLFNESPTNVQESLALTGHADSVTITKSWTYLRDRYIANGLSPTEATKKAKDKFKRF